MPTAPSEDPKKIGDKVLEGLKYAKKAFDHVKKAFTVVKNIGNKTESSIENKIEQAKSIIRSVSCVGKERVKTNVKFLAKNVLKPIVNTIQKNLSEKNGTHSFGLNLSLSPGIVVFNAQIGVSIDNYGNVVVQFTKSAGINNGTPGISLLFFDMETNAPNVDKLKDEGISFGGSVCIPVEGFPLSVGADFNIIPDRDEEKYYEGITKGIGIGTPGGEVHINVGKTYNIDGTDFNIWKKAKAIYDIIMEW